jgi:tetratricopeptide (TPR) repeat protein
VTTAAHPGSAGQEPALARVTRWDVVLPGLLVVVLALVLAVDQGGFAATTWYTAGLFLLALVMLVLALAPVPAGASERLVSAGVVAFAAFACLNLLSVLWAEHEGSAVEGGNRAVVYALALFLLARRAWPRVAAEGAVALIAAGVGLIAAGVIVASAVSDDPSSLFLEGRLASPIDYANATANLWLLGFFPALWLGSASPWGWPWRAAGLALAALLAQVALLSQSRGAVLALSVGVIAYLALAARRGPALAAVLGLAGLCALGFDTLTAVREAATPEGLEAALGDARRVILASCAAAAVLGAAGGLLARRLPQSARNRRAGDVAVAVAGLVAVVAALAAIGNSTAWLDDRWEDFKTSGYEEVEQGETRFSGSLGSNRYDFYRVALRDFSRHPVAGAGSDNFAVSYLRERRSPEAPRHPHSLAMRLLGQTGVLGTALFCGFLGCLLAAAWRARRRATLRGRALQAAALAGFAAWLAHGLVDWLWAFPALTLLALALLTLCALGVGEPRHVDPGARVPSGRARLIAFAPVALVIAVALAGPGLAARYTQAAYDEAGTDPGRTLQRLDRAAELDPFSAEPLIARGIIARRAGRPQIARAALERAVDREPSQWFAQFELALEQAAAGDRGAAEASLRRAERLNPGQRAIAEVRRRIAAKMRPDPTEFEAMLRQQLERRLVPTGGEAG